MGIYRNNFYYYLCGSAFILWSGCSFDTIPRKIDGSSNCGASNTEYAYLVDSDFVSNPATSCGAGSVCGRLSYQKRLHNVNGQALTDTPCTPAFPVQHALVELMSPNGSSVYQRVSTNADGDFLFTSINTSLTYRVQVTSKTSTSDVIHRVSVLDTTGLSGQNYKVAFDNVRSGQRVNYTIPIRDGASGVHLAGAFNILSVLTNGQQKIASRLGGIFDRDLEIYWQSGNNYSTTGYDSDVSSSTAPGKMYIIGGKSGLQSSTDTDEFDDSVLLHELAHFVDDSFSTFDTPGGAHSFYAVDVRLAWAEGFADFFSAYLRSAGPSSPSPPYRDTVGYGANSYSAIEVVFETNQSSISLPYTDSVGTYHPEKTISTVGPPNAYSVRQTLWDLYDSVADNSDTVTVSDTILWTAFTGLKSSAVYGFRGMDTVVSYLDKLAANPDIDAGNLAALSILRASEGMDADYFKYHSATVDYYPRSLFANILNSAQTTWTTGTSSSTSTDTLSICDTAVSLTEATRLAGEETQYYCWLSGRRIRGLWEVAPNFSSFDAGSNYLSKRWFRLSPSATGNGTYRILLKSSCLPEGPGTGVNYQSTNCTAATTAADNNNYLTSVNDLNMRLWRQPATNERYHVGRDSSLLLTSSTSTAADNVDDDDFDGNPSDSDETSATGVASDTIDANAGSESMEWILDSTSTYFIEVYGNTSGTSSPSSQMEGRFRVSVCCLTSSCASTCNSVAPKQMGKEYDF